MTKKIVTSALKELPQEFNLDELFEKLVFIEKVEEGLKEIEEGKTIAHSEMKKVIEAWRK